MEACRDLCIDFNEPCTAYHFNTNPDTQLLNCAIFVETREMEGNNAENYDCYQVKPDEVKPLVAV